MPLTDPVPSSAFDVLERNIQDTDKFVNQETGTFTNRVGKVIKPIPVIEAEANAAVISLGWTPSGEFATGFTYTKLNDVGRDSLGSWWRYNGSDLPKVITAGTVPSSPNFSVISFETAYNVQWEIGKSVGYSLDDQEGFKQALLLESGKVDSGLADTPTDSQRLDAMKKLFIQSPFNNDKKHFISCIPRVSAVGALSLLNDTDHETLGFSSAEKVGDFIMRINYTNTYTQVNNLSITIDDALCKYGVFTGGSVGTAYTDFTAYAQLSGLIDTTDLTFTGSGLFPNGAGVAVSYVDDVLIIDHDNHAFLNDSCVVTQRYALGTMTDFGVSQNASQINIIPHTELAGYLIYNGTNFVIDPAKPWGVSAFQTGVTFAWDNTVNALKVTHPVAKDYRLQVTPSLGGYASINAEATTLTTFHVYFFSVSGVQLTSPNTNMKINFERAGCQVRGIIPFGAKFHMRAGMTPIRSENLGSVSGNNFWVSGMMQF